MAWAHCASGRDIGVLSLVDVDRTDVINELAGNQGDEGDEGD